MNTHAYLIVSACGFILGSLYGLLVASAQRGVFISITGRPLSTLGSGLYGALRLIVGAGLATYLLLSPSFHLILVALLSSTTGLVVTILRYKDTPHARH